MFQQDIMGPCEKALERLRCVKRPEVPPTPSPELQESQQQLSQVAIEAWKPTILNLTVINDKIRFTDEALAFTMDISVHANPNPSTLKKGSCES